MSKIEKIQNVQFMRNEDVSLDREGAKEKLSDYVSGLTEDGLDGTIVLSRYTENKKVGTLLSTLCKQESTSSDGGGY